MGDAGERTNGAAAAERRFAVGTLDPGATAGDYVVTDVIAQGGGGTVYGARHATTGRLAAVKVLHPSLSVVPKMVERFRREIHVLNLLRHPGIVEVWEVGALLDGRPFFVMERLQGKTVSQLLEEGGRMLPDEALEIFEPVCLALAAAHSAGVIHRDVKTTNIMIVDGAPRRVKLLDFGVAKLEGPTFGASGLTTEGQAIGTPASMAPEQILGRSADARTDIYGLGVLLYRMLTGRPPFMAVSPLAQMRQHLEEPAPRPSLRAPAATALDSIVLRCMEKDADRRYGSIQELLAALGAAVSGPPHRAPAPSGEVDIAAAIYVEMRVPRGVDDDDVRLSDHMSKMLDLSEDALAGGELLIGLTTGNEVLGVCCLPAAPEASSCRLARVLDVAMALRARLDELEREDPRVHANICLHVGEVRLRAASGSSSHAASGSSSHAASGSSSRAASGSSSRATSGKSDRAASGSSSRAASGSSSRAASGSSSRAASGSSSRAASGSSSRATFAVEVIGGPLFRTDLWAPQQDIGAVCATSTAMSRLHGREILASMGALVPLPPVDPERTLHPRAPSSSS